VQESREALVVGEAAGSLRADLDAIVELSESDPTAARQALWCLQANWPALERIERQVGGEPEQAALRLGAAIHLARAELASPAPELRRRLPELLELLDAD